MYIQLDYTDLTLINVMHMSGHTQMKAALWLNIWVFIFILLFLYLKNINKGLFVKRTTKSQSVNGLDKIRFQ